MNKETYKVANLLGATTEQVKAQYARNAAQLRQMEFEARNRGVTRKYRGKLASEWGALADHAEKMANS